MEHQTAPPGQRQLRRSQTDRVVGGVCGGLAHHLGLDPVLVRIITVALVIFGGSGILLYLIGWVAIPSEPEGDGQPAESVLDTAGTGRVIVGAVLVGVGGYTLVDQFVPRVSSLIGPLLLIAAGVAVLLLTTHREERDDRARVEDEPRIDVRDRPFAPAASDPPVVPPSAWAAEFEQRSISERPGRLVLGVLFVVGGALWLIDLTGVVDLNWRVVLPVALIITGLSTMLLAWRNQPGSLVGWGVALAVLVAIASVLPAHLSATVGERTERPDAIADLANDYALGAGTLTIDLRAVGFDSNRTVAASVGMGELVVLVPADVVVEVDASVGAGEARAFDRSNSGVGVGLTGSFPPHGMDTDADRATLTLDLSVGLGQIEVRR